MNANRQAVKKGVLGTFTGKCCDSNVMNNNDMHLGREVFEKLMDSAEYKRAMQNRHYVGFLGHPADMDCQDDRNACIVMTDMRLLDNGEIEGDFDLVDTPVGNIVKSFIDAGVKYGISIRGLGEVDSYGEVDPDEFIFRGFDLVRFPAYDDCIVEFKEIAASTDVKKKAQYKKICASIDANIKDIKSCEALELIKAELPEGSDEFNKVQEQINSLSRCEDETCEDDVALELQVMQEKLNAVTELYIDAMNKLAAKEADLVASQIQCNDFEIECKSLKAKQARLDRIVASQIKAANESCEDAHKQVEDIKASLADNKKRLIKATTKLRETEKELANTQKSYDTEVTANTRLRERLSTLSNRRKEDQDSIKASNDLNLKYQRKIEANSEAISQKDSAIEDLKSQLNETVIANKRLESEASNLDEKNRNLLSRVEAAEEMVASYQQAYANMYANALGVYLTGLPITAATSVEELRRMINAGTSTASIPAAPSYTSLDELDEEDIVDEDFDDGQYSADLVSI